MTASTDIDISSYDERTSKAEAKAHRLFASKLVLLVGLSCSGLAAMCLASSRAHRSVTERWQAFQQDHVRKLHSIEEFHSSVGYGGMVHGLKNYVLRGDESYLDRLDASLAKARSSLVHYRQSEFLQTEEMQFLGIMEELLNSYAAAADRVRGRSLPPIAADRLAKVDDTKFLAAKESLQSFLDNDLTAAESQFAEGLDDARSLVVSVAGLCAFVSLSLGIWWSYQAHSIAVTIASAAESRANEHESLRRKAEEANKAKSTFLANMSHEIRTPMTSILGYAELLGGEFADSPEQSVAAARIVRSNAQHLLTIIDDILDVSKMEAGQFHLEITDANPVQIVQEVAALSQPSATSKNIDLQVFYDTPIPLQIRSDPTRLRQILLNLVSNALKFTDRGGVMIRLAFDPACSHLSMSVVDTGIGMTPEQRNAIAEFAAFRQADMSTTRKFGGTGLGLNICSALTRMLGGRLELESVYGQGTTFTATIQVAYSRDVKMWRDSASDPGTRTPVTCTPEPSEAGLLRLLEGAKVLLAEDGADNQRLICHYIERAGAMIEACENGEQAIEHIKRSSVDQQPQIVLMDMQMPVVDGYQATRTLRRLGYSMPIIALTAHAMEDDRQKCLDAGCDDYVSKPINRTVLLSTCGMYVEKQQKSPSTVQAAGAFCDIKDAHSQLAVR